MATLTHDNRPTHPTPDALTRAWGHYTAESMRAALDATAWQDTATDEFPEEETDV